MDWMFWSFIAAGSGVLALAARQRGAATAARSTRLGMTPRPDLTEVPSELQGTALWALTEGGTERGVVGGVLSLAAHDVEITCFDLEDHRRLRFEWAWLDVATPFRLHTPLTIVACRIPRALPHLLIKRAGPGDTIAPRAAEHALRAGPVGAPVLVDAIALGAAAHVARALTEFKDMAEAAPKTLGREALAITLPADWRAWGPPAATDDDRRLASALIGDGALAPEHELVIETLGPLILAYVASSGPLAGAPLDEVVDAAIAVCERALAKTPVLGPRGVVD
ncbi:MAG: hypothetical protein K8W52_42825 [Deltaproteobacteria bacterium]|nr:hypothetical protein [Deltaproteobacteria bacterium]